MYFNRKNAEQKNWRMIKKGKHFLFGCSLVFAIGATLVTPTVQADTAEAKVDATVGTAQAKPNAEGPTYAAPAATSPVATEAVEANSATTVVSADKSQLEAVLTQAKAKNLDGQEASVKAEVEAAIAEAEALVANGSASQDQINQSLERMNQAVASVKEVTEVAAEKTSEATTESSATPKVRSRRAVEGSVRSVDENNLQRAIVTKENFESFFQEGGTASYDKSTGTIKLTDDVSGQVGSAYLRFKIDSGQPFTFTGKVDIGNKYEGHKVDGRPGGDGVGFVFHTGKVDTIGQSGASIGMGTIKNAFGFKLDSWHNTSNPNANQNASADPKYGGRAWESNAFGSFYSSNNAGKVTTSSSVAKALNPAPSGQWVDFKIEYDKEKNFTVTYGSQTWTTNLKNANTSIMTFDAKRALTTGNPTFALSFLGSTGSGTNLQRVQIERFEFTAPQIVHMKFVDAKGNEIEASSAIPGDENEVINLSTQDSKIAAVEAKGYKLKRIDASKAPSYNEGNNTVTLTPGGQLLTYVFEEKDTTPPAAPTVNPVTAASTAVTGTAEPRSTVEVTLPNGSTVSAKADQDGNFSVPVSGLEEGKTVSVTATDAAGNKSTPTSVTVPDTTAPAAPTVNSVKAGATAITGTAEAGSTVEVTLQNGQKASAKAGENGEFSIPVPALNADDQISVTATDAAKNTSTPTKVTVKETVRPTLHIPYDDPATQAIYVYSGEENNIELKVTDNSGKIVKAYLALPQDNRSGLGAEDTTFLNGRTKGGLYLKTEGIHVETTATESTPAIVRVTGEVPKNTYTESSGQITRYLFAEDAAGNTGYEHVGDATTPGQLGRIRFMWKPQTFKYTAVAPSTPITSNTVPDASAIEKAVKDANPTFSDKIESVSVDGTNVKVTYKDGSTDVIPADSVFTIEPTAPTVTPVKNPSSLTQPEKDAVKKAVETANPSATKVEVGTDGTTTLTYSNGSTATLKPGQTVKAADANGAKAPATKTPVKDTANLTEDEKAAVKKAVETANPSATKVEVGQDGTTTVTFPDGSEATLKPAQTVVKAEDAAGIKEPATKTPVKDTANLTEDEKAAVKKAVETANPSATKVEVGQDGTTTVTFPDGSEATLKPAQTVVKAEDAAGIKEPATKTPVKDTANLTEDEKAAVKKAVETANPSATKVEVGQDGTTTVTFPDGSEATLKPAQTVVKAEDAAGIKEPATKTPVKDTANLTEDEKAAVKKAVETANPSATKVEVGQDGTTTVTFPDGSEATLKPAQTVVKAEDAAGIKEPATKTPVKDTANLTEDEKAAVKKAVETANPSATKVEVGQDGTTTVTFPDGSEATLKPAQTVVKAEDAAGIKEPATKTPVKDTANLTEDEKAAVKKAVETANPSATKVEVGQDGTTTVTFPDGSEATLKPAQTVVKAEDAAGIKEPATKTPVKDTANLTEDEKAAVKKAVETANPSATKVEVGQDGTTTVTFPDGSEATLKPAQTVVKAEDAAGIKEPATKTPVKDTANLTEDEKAAVKKAVETANPSATKVEVGQDGTTTVTFPDGSEATLKPAQTVVKAEDAAGIKEPATKTPVKDTANLTEDEKAAVKKAVETANPSATKVEVGQDGTTTVTFPDGSEATLKPAQTVVKAEDAAGIKEPATKTPVKDTANLTEDEKAAVKKAVETANPSATKVEVGQDGTTTVTFPDGSEATLKPAQTVVKAEDAAGIKEPATKTPVKDTANLTEDEKAAVKKAVETANPSATKVEVGQDGTTTVTFPDGSEATLKPAQTVVKAEDAAGIKEPATKTPVKDTANLTEDEKAAVKKAVETANPSATKVEVGQDGTTTVTFPDGSEATLKPAQTVVKAEDAAGIKEPATKTPVKDTANLTEDEKAAVKKAVETANPSATKVEVGQDGTTTVTFPDGSEATLKPAQTVVKAEDAAGIKEPATKTPVKDTANLTEDEKAAVKKAVETANPSATKVEVGQDGTTTVTFPDGSEATLKPAQTVVKAEDAAGIKEPATKTPVKDTANLTEDEKAAVKKAVETANPSATKVEVGQDGTTTVTFPDGSEATLKPAQTVVKAEDAAGIKEPATKTPVKDTANLTEDEKAAVKKAVETANPSATKVEVGQDGTTTVTFPDGSEATLKPAQTVVKAEDAAGIKEPATKTPVKDTANLTEDEKAAVKKAVETANPSATKVEVGQDGTTTVTFPDGSEATLKPAQTVVKAEDAAGIKEPATKTPVKDTANLTEDEKAAVKKAVETANPSATKVEVGQDGTTTVTFPDGSEATLKPAQTVVKAEDAAGIKEPATKTPVKDTANLTEDEKAAVKKAVETANPSATKVEVGQDGTTTVTFPDGSEATLKPAQTVVKAEDAAGIKEPATKTPVKDTANLTEDEKAAVKKAVETANPSATKVEVGQDGTTTVTFPDGSEATLKPAQTVVKAEDAAGIKEPATKTPVKDTANLTEDEKAAVKKAVETANPSATKVEVGQDGTTTVTFPDGSEATLKPAQTVVKAEDAAGIKEPATKTPVKDTANLTEDEKAAVKKAVETANPSATKVEVGQDGTTTVTFPDGSEATLKPAQTVVKAEDAAGIKEPATKTPVKDTANLTEDEKAAVKKAVETANPSATKVEVGQDGTTTVTFPDGSEATLKPAQTVVKAEDAAGIKEPATKTPVKDTANLTEDEKAAVKKAVETANPSATKVEVGQDGTTTVTFPDGSEATLKPAQTVVKAEDAAGIKEPATKTPVKDTANLTEDEKAAVKKAVETANPSATKVEVGQDGTTTVTFPDGSEATLKPAQTVVKAEDAAGIKEPATKTPVKDTANLTEDEKAAVKKAVETANPSATKVEVGQDGTTTVTFPDGSEATLKPAQTVVKAEDAAGIKEPATKTPVKDTANLTEDEKAAVKKAVETANPSATKVEVGQDGTTTVTFPDGSEATLKPAQTVVKAEDAAGIKEPATKTPVKDTANLTEDEKAAVKKAVETANPSATKVEVGQDGTTTVTFPDGSEATLKPAQTVVKAEDAAGIKEPATKTPVKDTANLTEDEKAAVKKAVETANPSATKVEVGQDGTTTVTFPDGSEATLKPAQTVVKAEDAAGIKEPATKTPVKDTANLTEDEKAAVKKAVETANPSATKVEVGQDGTTTVTFPDGSEATLKPAQTVVKAEDAAGIKEPATKTPVKDTANLTEDEKAAVKKAVETANPSATKVEVGQDGTTTVTFPDGSEATLKPAQTVVKAEDAAGIKEPATKTPVKDTANLTEDEKAAVKKAVETANPSATKVEVGQDGTTTVTFPDGSEATLKPAQTVVKAEDAAGIKEPATKTPVKDTANLTEDEKAAVKKAVETANPSATKVEVGQDGTTTVTFPDGSEATLKPAQTVVKAEDAAGIKEPATKTPVKDTANLTEDEKAAVKKAVETANPSATKVEVGQDGTTTVTFPDGSEATLKPAQTVAPAAPVVNPVKAGDTAVTGTAEAGSTVEVTLPDGTKATATADKDGKFSIPVAGLKAGDKVSVTATDAAGNKSGATDATVAPAAPVVNPVKAGDTAVTGTAEAGSTVEVTLPDGTKATATADKDGKFSIPVAGLKAGDKVSVTATDAAGNKSGATDATVAPAAPVVNPVKAGDTAVTGTAEAGSTVEVTLPDGTKATATADKDGKFSIPVDGLKAGDKVSVTATDAAGNKSGATDATVAPAAPVVNPVKAGDTAVTGTAEAGSTVEVTLPDGTKATATADKDGKFSIPVAGLKVGDKVSVTATDAAGNKSGATDATVAPAAPVVNPVKAGDTAVTGTAEAGSTVEVTLPDGTKATTTADKDGKFSIPVDGLKAGDKVSVTATDAAGNKSGATDATVAKATPTAPSANDGKVSEANGAKAPALTPVVDPSNLTDAEKAKIAEEVKKANPTATDIKVNNDGSVVVTFADGSVAVIATEKAVKKATKESSAKETTKKAGAKELPNTGTEQSNVSLGLALLAAVTGGLLISKKRKEEE